MRYTCLALILALVACDGGDPYCGDGLIDLGEQCDDGGNIGGDGCSATCVVESRCGNGTLNGDEQCDDGNTLSNDGCSTTCTIESPVQYTITANWQIKTVAGATATCPPTYDTAALVAQEVDAAGNPIGTPIIDLFNCSAGTGTNNPIDAGTYDVWISIQNTSGSSVYATSVPARINLNQNATLTAQILTDGGYFSFAWTLEGEVSGSALTCVQASATSVELTATIVGTTTATSDLFDCADGAGVTAGMIAQTYTVSIQALDAANLGISNTPELTNRVIQAPNKVTNLGTVVIPIIGL